MRTQWMSRFHRSIGAVSVVYLFAAGVAAADRVTVPAGTVIGLRMEDSLSSANSIVGDTFRATVVRSVFFNDRIAVPANSRVDGRVTVAIRAAAGVRSGVIGVAFFRLRLPDNSSYDIEGGLTSLESGELQQGVERSQYGPTLDRVFVGGRAQVVSGAATATATDQRSRVADATEAVVPAGSDVAMQLLRPVTLNLRGENRDDDDRVIFTSAQMIRGAQVALKDRNYYRGPITGVMDETLSQAIRRFQSDQGRRPTGELDQTTASLLGLVRVGEIPARNPRLSAAIRPKAQSLLDQFEAALGVRIDDIRPGLRSNRILTEWDLDLLLQVNDFNHAAQWYDQASGTAGSDEAASVAARILLRSADRVELDLQQAREGREFRSIWDSIQSDLERLGRQGVWNHGEGPRDDERPAEPGRFRWQGIVDGTDNVVLRGSTVGIEHLRSKSVRQASYDLPNPFPPRSATVTLRKVRGRGEIRLLEHPGAANNYTAVVQVDDQSHGGAEWYEFTLEW